MPILPGVHSLNQQIHIWLMSDHPDAAQVERYQSILQAANEPLPQGRAAAARLCGRVLRRQALAQYLDCDPTQLTFKEQSGGKPYLTDQRIRFNVSHSHGIVACAVTASTEIGIDVEAIPNTARARRLGGRYFSKQEQNVLDAADDLQCAQRFCDYWVLKEAWAKKLGASIWDVLDSSRFGISDSSIIASGSTPDIGAHQFELFAPDDNSRMALCYQGMSLTVRVFRTDTLGSVTEVLMPRLARSTSA